MGDEVPMISHRISHDMVQQFRKKTRISWHGVVSVSGDETLPKTNSKFAPEK